MAISEESRQRTLAAMREAKEASAEGSHLLSQLGIRDVEVSDHKLVIEMPVTSGTRNTRGGLNGGLMATLIDMAAGRLAYNSVDEGHSTATTDMNVHFMLPVVEGPARATATIVRKGTRMIVTRVDVEDVARDRLAATAVVQFMVLEYFS